MDKLFVVNIPLLLMLLDRASDTVSTFNVLTPEILIFPSTSNLDVGKLVPIPILFPT